MELKHMNKWDQNKRARILIGFFYIVVVLSAVRIYFRDGLSVFFVIFFGLTTAGFARGYLKKKGPK
jgi:hypothetical protein